jgi:hypothetical protein
MLSQTCQGWPIAAFLCLGWGHDSMLLAFISALAWRWPAMSYCPLDCIRCAQMQISHSQTWSSQDAGRPFDSFHIAQRSLAKEKFRTFVNNYCGCTLQLWPNAWFASSCIHVPADSVVTTMCVPGKMPPCVKVLRGAICWSRPVMRPVTGMWRVKVSRHGDILLYR